MVNATLPRAKSYDFSTFTHGIQAWRLAPLPLRLMLGIGFLLHGWSKGFGGHDNFVSMLGGLGVPIPGFFAWFVWLLELVGGWALILGAFVGVFSVLLMIEMGVAALLVHLPSGFAAGNVVGMGPQGPIFGLPGYEVNLLYIAGLLSLFLMGAGAWSVDTAWAAHKRSTERLNR